MADTNVKANGHIKSTWEAPNGLKVQLVHVSQFVVMAAGNRVKMPEVPTFINPDNEREEENPLDPAYVEALAKATQDNAMSVLGALIVFGTKIIVEPPDLMPFDSDDWPILLEELLGEKVPENPYMRRLTWMKYIALNDLDAFQNLLTAITAFNKRVPEEAVQAAADAFRSEKGRHAADGVSPSAEG
jgi:hypothetical protein